MSRMRGRRTTGGCSCPDCGGDQPPTRAQERREARAEIEAEIGDACDHPWVSDDGTRRWLGGWCDECEREIAARVMGAVPTMCDYPGCDQMAVALLANDAPLTSSAYTERQVCRWHRSNAFPEPSPVGD